MSSVKRKYVVPGDLVAEGEFRPIGHVTQDGNKFLSTRVGMAEVGQEGVRVIPLSGPYIPRIDDLVIGQVVDYSAFAWEVDINSPFFGVLPAQSVFGREYSPANESLSSRFAIGDHLTCKIMSFDRTRDPLVTVSGPGLGKVDKGEIVKISPTKVPRLIGKKGLMIKSIEAATNTRLAIGQNGIVVTTGPSAGVEMVRRAIRLIEEQAHLADLGSKVEALFTEAESGTN